MLKRTLLILCCVASAHAAPSNNAADDIERYLAERGIVTVIPDYRLYPEVVYPAFLDDCAAAVAWAMDNAAAHGADPGRLHVAGHSAGAYNAAMLALDARWLGRLGRRTDRLAGLVGLAGPYDFLPIVNPDVKPVFNRPGVEDPAPADSQPLRHVSAAAPRSLLIAARDDALVNPQRNTGGLAQALRDPFSTLGLSAHGDAPAPALYRMPQGRLGQCQGLLAWLQSLDPARHPPKVMP